MIKRKQRWKQQQEDFSGQNLLMVLENNFSSKKATAYQKTLLCMNTVGVSLTFYRSEVSGDGVAGRMMCTHPGFAEVGALLSEPRSLLSSQPLCFLQWFLLLRTKDWNPFQEKHVVYEGMSGDVCLWAYFRFWFWSVRVGLLVNPRPWQALSQAGHKGLTKVSRDTLWECLLPYQIQNPGYWIHIPNQRGRRRLEEKGEGWL